MSYTKVNWDENTPLNANNLDTMDTGIDNNDTLANANETKIETLENQFSFSSNAGINTTLAPGGDINIFNNYVSVPSGKDLVLAKARFNLFAPNLRLQINAVSFGNVVYRSNVKEGDLVINETLLSGSYDGFLSIHVYNSDDVNRDINTQDSFWCLFSIE